jgi:hypothetical protein
MDGKAVQPGLNEVVEDEELRLHFPAGRGNSNA